jgi:hypothetical protein
MGVPVEEYISNIKANMTKFANSDTIYDREELLRALRDTFTSDGKFLTVLSSSWRKEFWKILCTPDVKERIQQGQGR